MVQRSTWVWVLLSVHDGGRVHTCKSRHYRDSEVESFVALEPDLDLDLSCIARSVLFLCRHSLSWDSDKRVERVNMIRRRILPALIAVVLNVVLTGALLPYSAPAQAQEVLSVALYPYVPEAPDLFAKLEAAFEAMHPEVNVALVERYADPDSHQPRLLVDDYYDGGLLQVEADIYEIDTVLLADMVQAGKITPIDLPPRDFLPEARAAIQIDGETWGVPHWICGNFLFYKRGDAAIARAHTWQELVTALQTGGSVLADFTGVATLAEWYLLSLAAVDEDLTSVVQRLRSPELFPPAVAALRSLLQVCPADACRSQELHHQPGAYARLVARGKARAYIGYAETLHYGLQEILQP